MFLKTIPILKKQLHTILRDGNTWSIWTLLVLGLLVTPIFAIVFNLFSGPGESWLHLVEHLLLDYSLNSFFLIIGCSLLTFLLGVSSAWIVSRYRFRGKSLFEWILILPLAIPSYITAYAYAGIFDYGGPFSTFMETLGISVKVDLMNLGGLTFVLSISLFPYVYVACRTLFLYQSGRLIEAAKLLGASEWRTFFKVILPMARPAIAGGLLLVIMEVLNDYGAAKYYGINTFTTGIFRAWFSLEEPATAIYLSALLLLMVFTFMGLERFQRRQKNYASTTKSSMKLPQITPTKTKRILLLSTIAIPMVLGFIIPTAQLVYWSVLTYKTVLSDSFFFIALQSLGIALATAFMTTLIALCVLYFPKWNRLRLLKHSYKLAILGYAVPGAVLAIGIMLPTLALDRWLIGIGKSVFDTRWRLLLNGTIAVLVYAYMIRFMAVAFNPLAANGLKIGQSLPESSRLLGKGPFASFLKIELPLLKPGILSAFILVFVDTMKELPLTLILKPYDVNTLAVKAYEYASDELIMEASLPSLCIIATGVLPIIILNKYILKEH